MQYCISNACTCICSGKSQVFSLLCPFRAELAPLGADRNHPCSRSPLLLTLYINLGDENWIYFLYALIVYLVIDFAYMNCDRSRYIHLPPFILIKAGRVYCHNMVLQFQVGSEPLESRWMLGTIFPSEKMSHYGSGHTGFVVPGTSCAKSEAERH